MKRLTRRTMLQGSAFGAVSLGTGALGARDHARPISPQPSRSPQRIDELRVGAIGLSRGLGVAKDFQRAGMEIAAVCDVDDGRLERGRRETGAPAAHRDMRDIFNDASIDAVIIATPDHWHTPAALLALQAGKHVYVEKPCSHNIREGRLLIDAAEETDRVVQVGTQTRSTPNFQQAIEWIHEGAIGELKIARAWNSQQRANIGHASPSDPPDGFDYDLWVGPAAKPPYQSNRHHYTWHWWHDFGTGDAGNDGVHELDVSVWGLNVDRHPDRITGHATKLYFDDDQEFPDTQHVTYEYFDESGDPMKKKVLVFENRIWTPYTEQGFENGVIFYGTEGYVLVAKSTCARLYGRRNELKEELNGGFSTRDHALNFAQAILGEADPNAPPQVGHLSATLAHLANMLQQANRSVLRFDPVDERVIDDAEANRFVSRTYREGHWATPK